MPLLKLEDYGMNETRKKEGLAVFADLKLGGHEMDGLDIAVGSDIYQRIALLVPENPNGTVLAFMHGGRASWGWKECIAFMAD
ncbi:MAG: hypothetical protein QGF09_11005, partial [Rhodospirillales bacterium]|nr:hypothetical protein [Rhodospirillales bacterium]